MKPLKKIILTMTAITLTAPIATTHAATLQEIQAETKAGTACKGCIKRIEETLEALKAE